MTLPISKTYSPMEAAPATSLPVGPQWQYEPKWDGFRCVAFRDNKRIDLQSKSGKPLTRYFPELVAAIAVLKAERFVLDGEIVIPSDGGLSFGEKVFAGAIFFNPIGPGRDDQNQQDENFPHECWCFYYSQWPRPSGSRANRAEARRRMNPA